MSTRSAGPSPAHTLPVMRKACRAALTLLFTLSLVATAPGLSPAPANAALAVSDPAHPWVLVNKARPLVPRTYVPPNLVAAAGSDSLLQPLAARQLRRLFSGAASNGHRLNLVSGYRSYSRQRSLYNYYVNLYGRAYASRISARPGHSEHQTGLAADVGTPDSRCVLAACFGSTPAGRWVAANAHRYGFIVRYPRGYERVTGYAYEPWHLRFVGPSLATRMRSIGAATLEQMFSAQRGTNTRT